MFDPSLFFFFYPLSVFLTPSPVSLAFPRLAAVAAVAALGCGYLLLAGPWAKDKNRTAPFSSVKSEGGVEL